MVTISDSLHNTRYRNYLEERWISNYSRTKIPEDNYANPVRNWGIYRRNGDVRRAANAKQGEAEGEKVHQKGIANGVIFKLIPKMCARRRYAMWCAYSGSRIGILSPYIGCVVSCSPRCMKLNMQEGVEA